MYKVTKFKFKKTSILINDQQIISCKVKNMPT